MSVSALLSECRKRGITLNLSGGRLRYRAPKDAITPELKAALAAHKARLVSQLQSRDAVATVLEVFPGATVIAEDVPATAPGQQEPAEAAFEAWAVGEQCPACGGNEYWLPPRGGYYPCARCHPARPTTRRTDPQIEDEHQQQFPLRLGIQGADSLRKRGVR
jgi:hypothetical protein